MWGGLSSAGSIVTGWGRAGEMSLLTISGEGREPMPERTCHNCIYSRCDQVQWLKLLWANEPLLPRCANHPQWPGELREVPGVHCENYRVEPAEPTGEEVRRIPLGEGHYALVDAADYEALNRYNWRFYNGYAARQEQRKTIYMHRQIMQPPEGMMVDHANHNKLDNRQANLRICTRRENILNQAAKSISASRFKGVEYRKDRDTCFARIRVNGKRRWLGTFENEVAAARAYDRAAVEHLGPFAHLNFPEEWPPERGAQIREQAGKSREEGQGERVRREKAKPPPGGRK